jgi:type IV secretion system protein VirB9
MIKKITTLILVIVTVIAVNASATTTEPERDPRIKTYVYSPYTVYRVDAYPGIATHIVFAPGETVIDHGTGFSKAWEMVANGKGGSGNYYLKPKEEAADSNLFITTNKRDYSFELILHKDWRKKMSDNLPFDPKMTFRIMFEYPQDEADRIIAISEEKTIKDRLRNPPKAANWNYAMQLGDNSEEIAPKMAFDDGRFTYLRFPNNREIPAVYQVAPDKSESIINIHVIDDIVVIQRVGREFVLRLGDAVIGLYNESYDPDGNAPQNGMTVPGLKRVIKGAK